MRPVRPVLLATLLVLAFPAFAVAQRRPLERAEENDAEWLQRCRQNWGDDDRYQACEIRQIAVRPTGRALAIDGRSNGSVHVRAWDGDSVRVTARLQASARSSGEAEAALKEIRVTTDAHAIRAEGPSTQGSDRRGWSVSYVVLVPRRFDLTLDANNGSLSVAGVEGRLDLETRNGSVWLADVGGDVHARTQNGSLNVELAGTGWQGTGLDAETQNGSVRLFIPDRYAAQFETGTVNGRIESDFPITVQGRISRQLSFPLNGGGKTVHVTTRNGSVRLIKA